PLIVKTERPFVTLQQLKRLVDVPRWVTEFEHVMHDAPVDAAGQDAEKRLQTFDIDVVPEEIRRHLVQHRTETWTERPGAREQAIDRFVRIFQSLDVRKEAACLDRDDEFLRRLSPPACERAFLRETVEGVIDLNRIENRRVEVEPLAG